MYKKKGVIKGRGSIGRNIFKSFWKKRDLSFIKRKFFYRSELLQRERDFLPLIYPELLRM